MSSEKQSENLCRRKPKISEARFVLFCSGGPKKRKVKKREKKRPNTYKKAIKERMDGTKKTE